MSDDFDPKDYVAKNDVFDPAAYVADNPGIVGHAKGVDAVSIAQENIPVAGPLINKADQGVGAVIAALKNQYPGKNVGQIYKNLMAQHAADVAAYQKENPIKSGVARAAGGLVMPVAAGGPVAQGVMAGGTQFVDALTRGEDLYDAGKEGLLAGGLGIGGGLLSKMPELATGLKSYASKRALKASGAMTKEMRDLNKAGFLESTGQSALEHKVVTPGASLEDIAERSAAVKDAAGKEIGEAVQQADDTFQNALNMTHETLQKRGATPKMIEDATNELTAKYAFSMANIGKRIRKELVAPIEGSVAGKGIVSKLSTLADDYERAGATTFIKGAEEKTLTRRMLPTNTDTVPGEYKKEVYNIIKEELGNGIARMASGAEAISKPGVLPAGTNAVEHMVQNGVSPEVQQAMQHGGQSALQKFQKANQTYAQMSNIEAMANKRLGGAMSNRENSLSDYLMEGAGLMHGGPLEAVGLGVVNKLGRRYAAPMQASAANFSSDIVGKFAKTKYGQILSSAASKGNQALAVTHYMLSQEDPEYRSMFSESTP